MIVVAEPHVAIAQRDNRSIRWRENVVQRDDGNRASDEVCTRIAWYPAVELEAWLVRVIPRDHAARHLLRTDPVIDFERRLIGEVGDRERRPRAGPTGGRQRQEVDEMLT